jgi:hypothetical protein
MWRQLVRRFWFIGLIVVVAGVGWYFSARRDDSGQITNSGNLQVQDLQIGDCFDLKDEEATEVSDVEAKPCSEGHKYELIHAANMPNSDYPTDEQFGSFLDAECIPAFTAYVGFDWETSDFYMLPFTPTEDTWNDGDRSIQCVVFDPENAVLTSSVRNAAR